MHRPSRGGNRTALPARRASPTSLTSPKRPRPNHRRATNPGSYHPDVDSYYWRGYAIKPYMGERKALKRPNGDHITQSKYLDFLVETARKYRAAPRPPPCPTTKPAGMA